MFAQSNGWRRSGFTLIELLLVMVILAILAAVVIPKIVVGRTEQARVAAAKTQITVFKDALEAFDVDNGRFPTTQEGLQALVEKPAGDLPNWTHYYMESVPVDPWGHPYVYRSPGTSGHDYDLFSCGPSGQEGGADEIH